MQTAHTHPLLDFEAAAERLKNVVLHTPLIYSANLSRKYQCNVLLKREDLQVVRSYKIRGAYNMMSSLSRAQLQQGVVTASAGNHAQGFAYSCKKLHVNQTKMFGEDTIEIRLTGDTFDDCAIAAKQFTLAHGMTYIPPFDDERIIEGQGTVGVEILAAEKNIDYLFIPVGGGGLSAGVGSYFKKKIAAYNHCWPGAGRRSFYVQCVKSRPPGAARQD